ncbi:MAG: hypothetical protein ACRD8Z_12690 [Nitrososphaeraceae archaeon]
MSIHLLNIHRNLFRISSNPSCLANPDSPNLSEQTPLDGSLDIKETCHDTIRSIPVNIILGPLTMDYSNSFSNLNMAMSHRGRIVSISITNYRRFSSDGCKTVILTNDNVD